MTTTSVPATGPTTDLHRAARVGDLPAVLYHLAAGQAIDPPDPEGHTPFLLACRHAEPDVFRALLNAGADAQAVNTRRMTGLVLVASTGVESLARDLVDRGADVNHVAARGLTPLMAAVMSENPYLVRLLVAAGADVRHMDAGGRTALRWARKLGNRAVVEALGKAGPPAPSGDGNLTADDLHRGATTGDVDLIRECLSAGVPVESLDAAGCTPLLLAARQGRRAAVQCLLQSGANPYRQGPGGFSPLLLAASNATALRAFVSMGVDLDYPGGRRGTTVLIHAARQGFEEAVRFLLASGADPRQADRDGRTAADHAAANGHRRIAELLAAGVAPAPE